MNEIKTRTISTVAWMSDGISEKPPHERTLSKRTDIGKNFSKMAPNVSVAPVINDAFSDISSTLLICLFLILIAVITLLICELYVLWKFRKLRQRQQRLLRTMGERNGSLCVNINRGKKRNPEYSSLYMGTGILSNDCGSSDNLEVQYTPRNHELGKEKASNITIQCNSERGQSSVSSDPRATTAMTTFNDSSPVEITTEL